MKRLIAALFIVVLLIAGPAQARTFHRAHHFPHPKVCLDLGFYEDGTPIVSCS